MDTKDPENPDFGRRYAVSDVETQQSLVVRRTLYDLWLAHHDNYSPTDKKIVPGQPASDQDVVRLIKQVREQSVKKAQKELDRIHRKHAPGSP